MIALFIVVGYVPECLIGIFIGVGADVLAMKVDKVHSFLGVLGRNMINKMRRKMEVYRV